MSVNEKRRKVIDAIYEEMSHASNHSYTKELAEIIKTLEAAELAEKEFELKEDATRAEFVNAERDFDLKEQDLDLRERELEIKDRAAATDEVNAQTDREVQDKAKLRELIVNAAITIGQAALWGAIFVHELKATRIFEVEGTETSAAGRWLKNSFPKVRLF